MSEKWPQSRIMSKLWYLTPSRELNRQRGLARMLAQPSAPDAVLNRHLATWRRGGVAAWRRGGVAAWSGEFGRFGRSRMPSPIPILPPPLTTLPPYHLTTLPPAPVTPLLQYPSLLFSLRCHRHYDMARQRPSYAAVRGGHAASALRQPKGRPATFTNGVVGESKRALGGGGQRGS